MMCVLAITIVIITIIIIIIINTSNVPARGAGTSNVVHRCTAPVAVCLALMTTEKTHAQGPGCDAWPIRQQRQR